MTQSYRRAQALLAIAALGAAGMFLGGEGWLGLNLGSIGATVLYAVLWLFLLANAAAEVFPDHWSPANKQAWISLVFVGLIACAVVNLVIALPGLGVEADRLRNSATRPAWAFLGMLIFGWIVVSSSLRKQDSGGVQFDERDLRIAHQASRMADGALALLVACLVVALMALPEQSRTWLRPLIAANVLIALLVARTLVESICAVWGYRRESA